MVCGQRELMPTVFLSAGEPSGDLHGANLCCALKHAAPQVHLVGFGGPRMHQAGCQILYPLTHLAVMGIWRVFQHFHRFLALLSQADRWLQRHRPDAVVLIDYPGFNWWLARRAHRLGIPVFYFVPPQIWAWASWRVAKMRRWVDHVLCNLPFEEAWYRARGVQAQYIGHPYFDELAQQQLDTTFIQEQKKRSGTIVGLLPGSRHQEVVNNFPTLLRTALRLQRQLPDVRFLIACYREEHRQKVLRCLQGHDVPIEAYTGRTPEIIFLARACVAVSGSVSLELLHRACPTVVVYRVGRFGLRIGRRLIRSPYITLVNLLAGEELYPEFLTDRCESRAIAEQVKKWLTDEGAYRSLVKRLEELRAEVGKAGACRRAAELICQVFGRKHRQAA